MSKIDESEIIRLKQAASDAAVEQLEDGMIVGLGSGSTATLAVNSIGRRVAQGLKIIGIPTSEKTAAQARGLNIPLATLGEYPAVDITIDGADEVDPALDLIKGGGGNELREKIVEAATARFLVVVDEGKLVPQLGTGWPVPIEVAQFGWQATAKRLVKTGCDPVMRMGPDGQPYVTDGGNYILDCHYGPIASPPDLQRELDSIVGLVEHGLFIGMAAQVIVAGSGGVRILTR